MLERAGIRAVVKTRNQYTITIPVELVSKMKLEAREKLEILYDTVQRAIIVRKIGGLSEDE